MRNLRQVFLFIFFNEPIGFFIYNSAGTYRDYVDDFRGANTVNNPQATDAVAAEAYELVFQLFTRMWE